MTISKIAGLGTIALASVLGVAVGGCGPKNVPPPTENFGAESAAGQSAAMVQRQSHDPVMQKHDSFGGGQAAGQAAAMQARMHAQGQHP